MIDKETYNKLSLRKKIILSIKTLNPERAFFSGISIIIGVCVLLALFVYILSVKTIPTPKYGSSINVLTSENPRYFSPFYASTPLEQFINGLTESGLMRKDENNNYVLDLAETIERSEDGLELDIKLKDNLKFNNGDALTVDDVLYTYNSILDPRVKALDKVKYEGLDFVKIDDQNLSIHLKKTYGRIDEVLTLGIIEKKLWDKENPDQFLLSKNNQKPTGSGRYYIDSVTSDNDGNISNIVLKSNSNFIGSQPFVTRININSYKSSSDLIQYISDNKVDMIFDAGEDSVKYIYEYDKDNLLSVKKVLLPRVASIYFNPNKNKAFSDKDVRRAIYEIIDRKELTEKVLDYSATSTYTIFPNSQLPDQYEYLTKENLDKILAPLASSTIHISIIDNDRQIKVANYLKNVFANYNISLEIESYDANQLLQNEIKNRDFEMLLFTTEMESNYDLYAFLHSSQRNAPGLNITGYTSKSLDQEIENIKGATSSVVENVALENIRTEFYKEYFYIPLYTSYTDIYTRNNINIDFPNMITSYKDLQRNLNNFYSETEKVWSITIKEKSKNLIEKIYKKIH